MNKEQFQKLIEIGFSIDEALDLYKPATKPEEPKTEPKAEPKTEPEPKPVETPSPVTAQEKTDYVTSEAFLASQKATLDAIEKLTKAVHMNNIRTAGTDEDPTRNRADEFIAQMITGMKKED